MFFKNYLIFFNLQTQGHYQNTERSVSSPRFYFICFITVWHYALHFYTWLFNPVDQYQPDVQEGEIIRYIQLP